VASVLIGGASGFLGTAIAESLRGRGDVVSRLVRRGASGAATVAWSPEAGEIDAAALESLSPDVVINLAGEPIAQRWTADRKRRIRDSRVRGTETLARAIAALPRKPATLLSGSAIGFYGANRGDDVLDEATRAGADFLADTARQWEEATRPASDAGVRVVTTRTGLVLSPRGGVLQKMLLPFQLGVGGRVGDGRQWMSWIGLDDYVRAVLFLLDTPTITRAANMVAPEAVRNEEFTATLARVLGRPALLPVPAVALGLAFGEMADATILASQRVVPKTLAGAGFTFRHPRLDEALRFELTR